MIPTWMIEELERQRRERERRDRPQIRRELPAAPDEHARPRRPEHTSGVIVIELEQR